MIRYSTQQIDESDIEAVSAALRSSHLTQGRLVEEFEEKLAEFCGAKYAACVSSGSAALHLTLLASYVPGQVILTSPLSFVATAHAIVLSDLEVDFADVDRFGNLVSVDVGFDGIIPVHFAGRAARLIARPDYIIEDAAHAFGSFDFDGCSHIGSCMHSAAACFSFHPVKPLTTAEGGAVCTNDEGLLEEVRALRSHGRNKTGLSYKVGFNYRMSELHAALGLSQLRRVDAMRARRLDLASLYDEQLRGSAAVLPPLTDRSSWHLYPVRVPAERRDHIVSELHLRGIGAQVHYRPLIPEHPAYGSSRHASENWPNAFAWSREEISLPLHSGLDAADVSEISKTLAGLL